MKSVPNTNVLKRINVSPFFKGYRLSVCFAVGTVGKEVLLLTADCWLLMETDSYFTMGLEFCPIAESVMLTVL